MCNQILGEGGEILTNSISNIEFVCMLSRALEEKAQALFKKYPIVGIMGPRQSGKTTFANMVFSDLAYVNLEDIDIREIATADPRGFLLQYSRGAIIDEVQNVPELFSYLQTISDERDCPSQFILIGSQNFLLHEKITQSLAGRIALTTLLPLSFYELKTNTFDVNELIQKGFYPRIYRYDISPNDFFPSYLTTYVERDIRQIINVSDLLLFQKFLKLCAGRIGQILNFSSLATECGISQPTAKRWLSLLVSSYVLFLPKPYHKNFNKRLVKSPKLYFYDTGLACHLLEISKKEQLSYHHMRGELFENFVIVEIIKSYYSKGKNPPIYFWRNQSGVEIDVIIDHAKSPLPIEIKSGQTIRQNFFKNLKYWQELTGIPSGILIYSGKEKLMYKGFHILPWKENEVLHNF